MKFILFKRAKGGFKQVSAAWLMLAVVPLAILGFVAGAVINHFVTSPIMVAADSIAAQSEYEAALIALGGDLKAGLKDTKAQVQKVQHDAGLELSVMSGRLAELQARLARMESVARNIADEQPELAAAVDFSAPVAVGGPGAYAGSYPADVEMVDVVTQLQRLEARLQNRERQLGVLENLVVGDDVAARLKPTGRPIVEGWLSSPFGKRTDPFTGKQTWHSGIDFAAADGSDIVAVGDGLVTFAGRKHGYGLLIEVSHADGYATRYAHNRENLVAVGDQVVAGEVVGRIGSSGRSTGPHVHFELLKNGKKVNPYNVVAAVR